MTQEPITNFREEPYRFLSNFAYCTILFDSEYYPSVEHAYQAAKTTDKVYRELIRKTKSPAEAKRLGKGVPMRKEWLNEEYKIATMRRLLQRKFEQEPFRTKLLETGDRALIEGNYWFDDFWGVCTVAGQNHLGRLLTEIRAELRSQ